MFFIKIMVALDSSHTVQVSIPFIAKDIAILRLSVTGGGHLEFSHEKVDEKNGNSVFSLLGQYK